MNIAGIVIAKQNSNRFPNKNIYQVDGKPMFYHSVDALLDNDIDVYVATDSQRISEYCHRRHIPVIHRGINISQDEQPLFEVLKYVYQSLPKEYDIIVMAMANCINCCSKDVQRAVHVLIDNNLQEVRSYNSSGVENGLLVFRKDALYKHEVSTYVGAITTNAREIHYETEVK